MQRSIANHYEVLLKRGKIEQSRRVVTTGEPTETVVPSPRELTESVQKLGSLHGTNLGPLIDGNSCVAWADCETPRSEILISPCHV